MALKNLGLIKAIFVGTTAPTNEYVIWYDDNVGIKKHKYYDQVLGDWVLLAAAASSDTYRADRIIMAAPATTIVSFSSALGAVDGNIVLDAKFYDSTGVEVAPTITNITKDGFTAITVKAGTLHYHATLKN